MFVTIPYTYLIRHVSSGNLYHGSRTKIGCNPNELLKEEGYITSSKIVKKIIADEGLDSFEIVNIEIFEDTNSARLAEEKYHNEFNVRDNVYYLNQWNAGHKWYCEGHSNETRSKISASLIGKMSGEKHPLYGKKHSEETKEKFKYRKYASGENHYMHGKSRSEESKRKTSETLKGMFLGEKSCWYGKKGELAANYGNMLSDEAKKSIGDKNRGRKHTEEEKAKMRIRDICPHCGKESTRSIITRYHRDNCKHKVKDAA